MASGKFTWRITNYSERQSEDKICSDVFTVGGFNWYIQIYPKGSNNSGGNLSMYLYVANTSGLPSGWTIGTKLSLTMKNQLLSHDWTTKDILVEFTAKQSNRGWHFKGFDSRNGYLVNDTLIVEAEIEVLNVSPVPTVVLETFFSNLDKFITDCSSRNSAGLKSKTQLPKKKKSETPTLEEVEMAKKSLKECLSDTFRLNIKDRLATSLETLCRAKIGLSSQQQQAIQLFQGEFDDFVADFLNNFEQENSELELNKLATDEMFRSLKNYHETQRTNKRRLNDLTKKEEEHKKKMEEAKSKKAKLISEWHTLMTKAEETKSKYMAQQKKLKEAKERKKIADKRMSRSISAWSLLKAHFAN